MKEQGVYTGRTLILKTLREKGVAEAKRLALLNIADLYKIILYNESIGIRFYRMSNPFPHFANPQAPQYRMDFAAKPLAAAGKLARELGHRITMHPPQFIQLGSPTTTVRNQSAKDLQFHAQILQYMGLEPKHGSVLIVHGGGSYGDKSATLDRWATTFTKLPEWVRQYIVLENDEFQYSVMDLLPLCEKLNIPLCLDAFHDEVWQAAAEEKFDIYDPPLVARIMQTWRRRGIQPKVHYSQQAPGKKRGAHGDCVTEIPAKLMNICKKYDACIMLESKLKDVCALKILNKQYIKTVSAGRIDWIAK